MMKSRSFYKRVLYADNRQSALDKTNSLEISDINLVSAYKKFVASIDHMISVVLVPSLLLDLDRDTYNPPMLTTNIMNPANPTNIPALVQLHKSLSLYEIYHLVRRCRDLLDSVDIEDGDASAVDLHDLNEIMGNGEGSTYCNQNAINCGNGNDANDWNNNNDSGFFSLGSMGSAGSEDELSSEGGESTTSTLVKVTSGCVKNLRSLLSDLRETSEYLRNAYLFAVGLESE